MLAAGLGQARRQSVSRTNSAPIRRSRRRAGRLSSRLPARDPGFMSPASVGLWPAPEGDHAVYVEQSPDPAKPRTGADCTMRLLANARLFQVFENGEKCRFDRRQRVAVATMTLPSRCCSRTLRSIGGLCFLHAGGGAAGSLAPSRLVSAKKKKTKKKPGLWWGLALGLAVVAILLTLPASFARASRTIGQPNGSPPCDKSKAERRPSAPPRVEDLAVSFNL